MNKLFIQCECGNEIVSSEFIEQDNFVELCIYTLGYNKIKYPFRHKIDMIKKILKDGNPYNDQIILKEKEIIKLRDYLNEVLKKI